VFQKIVATLLLGFLVTGCAHQASFISDPPGARVIVDGAEVGVTPCNYPYRLSPGGQYEVVIEKEGYDTMHHLIKADEVDREIRNRWLAAGVVWSPLWLGTLFTKKLKDGYEFILRKSDDTVTAQKDQEAAPIF
jgi:hypothetical protein